MIPTTPQTHAMREGGKRPRPGFAAGRRASYWRALAFGAALAGLPAVSVVQQAQAQTAQRQVPQAKAEVTLSFAPVVKKVLPAVVNVYAQRVERQQINPLFDDPFFRQFFGARPQTQRSLGSGVIVDSSGLVVTNNHVIAGMTEVRVALSDRRELQAEVILRDQRTDLAVLRIKEGKNFPAISFGDSDALEVGDLVLAVGNPFGVGQTVTQGIVSGLARTQTGISDYGFFIQTDAAINPGNSGGALVDVQGRLAGINTAIYSRSGGSVGIGFAIPVNMVESIVRAAKGGGKIQRPWVGATLQAVTKEIADSLGMDRPLGALISKIHPDSAALRAGMRRGDIIVAVDGREVPDPESFGYRLATKALGSTSAISILRQGKKVALNVRMEAAPETPPREQITIAGPSPFAGAVVVNYSPATADEYSVQGDFDKAVLIAEIKDGSNAAQVGLQPGDVILSINDTSIKKTADLRNATRERRMFWKLSISRKGQVLNSIFGG
ncbi:MAG: DegQ family serine endoprotease [Beijerinckiaceae bacterium]